MKLILHAGPMKTGSTAFQDLLSCNRDVLHQSGIRFRWLRLPELDNLRAVMQSEEQKGWPKLLILSHECLCRVSPERLRSALAIAPAKPMAILVARPLREIYPSLYLQNLKGHVMRTSSFEQFLDEQSARDRHPEHAQRGQVFRYQYLEEQLNKACCDVHWLRYSSTHLLQDLLKTIFKHGSLEHPLDGLKEPPKPEGLNPRRSLDGAVVSLAREVNRLCREGVVVAKERQELLAMLLDVSDRVRQGRQELDAFRMKYVNDLEALDDELNGSFWCRLAGDALI